MQPGKSRKAKRILAIGDIHGCSLAFDALLEAVKPGPDDLLITLGDYIDRGPDAKKVTEHLVALRKELDIVCLAGNHEEMVLEWRDKDHGATLTWWSNGGLATLRSYCQGDEGWLLEMFWKSYFSPETEAYHAAACDLIPPEHWEFFENCIDWYETAEHIFVHGQVNPLLEMAEQSQHVLHWARFDSTARPHQSGKKVICAHTPQYDGRPADIGHAVCIDTYVYGGQWLTCLEVGSGRYYQANYLGDTRIIE
jgi:serine/threonine protein phosphatase 1